MKRFVFACVGAIVMAGAAQAQQTFDKTDLNQVQLRYSECTAFYYAGAVGYNAYGKTEDAEALNAQAHAALELAVVVGTRLGLSETDMNARMASAENWVMERAGRDLGNYEELITEMGAPCLDLLEYPPRALFGEGSQPAGE